MAEERDEGYYFALPWLTQAPPVDRLLVKLYGAKTVGKDRVTEHLERINPEFKKAKSIALGRLPRAGESLLASSGIREDVFDSEKIRGKRALAVYPVDTIVYLLVEEEYTGPQTPLMHISGRDGLETLEKGGNFPHGLEVLITLDTRRADIDDDLRTRAIWRLAKYRDRDQDWPHGSDWDYETGTDDDKKRVHDLVAKRLRDIHWFESEGSLVRPYHAIFENNRSLPDDVRCLLPTSMRDRAVVTQGIALRINELFRRIKSQYKPDDPETYKNIDINALHDTYVRDCYTAFLGNIPRKIKTKRLVTDNDKRLKNAIDKHAETYLLAHGGLFDLLKDVHVVSSKKSRRISGRYNVFLASISKHPLTVADITAEDFTYDFHVLGVIAEHVYQTTGTLPRYVVRDGQLKGVLFSLSDRMPTGFDNRFSYELFIGYK